MSLTQRWKSGAGTGPAAQPAVFRAVRSCICTGLRTGLIASPMLLGACSDGLHMPSFGGSAAQETATSSSVRMVDRDVEAPDVFDLKAEGLWDGRPSLGGVWVAYPDVKDPERVIIRNPANGKFVIGALFRRERDMPGPKLQVSADAAGTLGMLAGQPAALQVTALRRDEPAAKAPAAGEAVQTSGLTTAEPITAEPIAGKAAAPAGASVTAVVSAPSPAPAATGSKPAAEPAAKPAVKSAGTSEAKSAGTTPLSRPYVQIGIFSVEANAETAAKQMRGAGLEPKIRRETIKGKAYWRVVIGPAGTTEARAAAIAKVKSIGYPDAYAVSQ